MFHVERPSAPEILNSREISSDRRDLERFFGAEAKSRSQKVYEFRSVRDYPRLFDAVVAAFNSRCAYCETNVTYRGPGSVDHFRPTSRAVNLDGSISKDHYWWLYYEWTNLYLSCPYCNQCKGARFPVKGSREAVGTPADGLFKEDRLLLDPCQDHPERELLFTDSGLVSSGTERGRTTIEVLSLNRAYLVEARGEELKKLQKGWQEYSSSSSVSSLDALLSLVHPYQAFRRQFLQQWAREMVAKHVTTQTKVLLRPLLELETALPGTGTGSRAVKKSVKSFQQYQEQVESYSLADKDRRADYYLKTRVVERVEIQNFRSIEELDLQFPCSPANRGSWLLLLLGENGTGKSSILQAVALTLMGKQQRRRLWPNASLLIRRGAKQATVRVHLSGISQPVELKMTRGQEEFAAGDEEPKLLLLGYGSTRLLPRPGIVFPQGEAGPYVRADNLFNPFVPLADASRWLCGLPSKQAFDDLASGLKKLLVLDDDAEFHRYPRTGKVELHQDGDRCDLEFLSDGYQSVIALAVDIMKIVRPLWPRMEDAEGLVLIDEIDAHLHPRWKMQIVDCLRRTFPRVQFLMTSHDPLCLRGLEKGETAVLWRDEQKRVQVITDLPAPKGLRIDQLLTSEYFGLNSTLDPETDLLFREYYTLLALPERSEAQSAHLEVLKGQLQGLRQLGTTPREQVLLETADQYLALARNAEPEDRPLLKAQTRDTLTDLWHQTAEGGSS